MLHEDILRNSQADSVGPAKMSQNYFAYMANLQKGQLDKIEVVTYIPFGLVVALYGFPST